MAVPIGDRRASRACIVAVVVLALAAGAAAAEPILTFGFTELLGDYDGNVTFVAQAGAATSGDVTRTVPGEQTALYASGFDRSVAGYAMTMTLTDITATDAQGAGSLTITDVDGDTLTADFSGFWTREGSFGFFRGVMDPVLLSASGDGVFEGPSGGSFDMDFSALGPQPFSGAIVTLSTGQWFTPGQGFSDQSTLVSGVVVPEPASVALLVLGGLALVPGLRRRRV